MALCGWGGRENLGRVEGRKIVIRICSVKKIVQLKKERKQRTTDAGEDKGWEGPLTHC